MIATVIALGTSAQHWTPHGLTIGVNDYLRFGRQADVMIVVNAPHKFTPDRLNRIKNHKGLMLTNTPKQWSAHVPKAEAIRHMGAFNRRVQRDRVYHSSTSPMIAISYAIQQGADEVVIYGVDFKDHRVYKAGTKKGDHEIATYKRFFESCAKLGVRICLGAPGSVFENFLPNFAESIPNTT